MKRHGRWLAWLLCVVMLLGVIPMAAIAAETSGLDNFVRSNHYSEETFSDVSSSDWFYENVKAAYELGLMIGQGEAFGVNSDLTIAEAVTLAARIHSIYSGDKERFQQGDPWYQVYADYVTAKGLADLSGLDMSAPATRAQFAVLLNTSLPEEALPAVNAVADDAIPDVKSGDPAAAAIYKLYRAGILTGNDEKGTFAPASNIRRSEVAAIVTRMADVSLRKTVTLGELYKVTFSPENVYGTPWTVTVAAGNTVPVPEEPVKKGFTFKGWFTEAVSGSKFDFNTPITGNLTLYAHWSIISYSGASGSGQSSSDPTPEEDVYYTVKFDSNGGNAIPDQSVLSGSRAVQPEDPEKDGFIFVGWYLNSDLTVVYSFNTAVMSDLTLYARWRVPAEEEDSFLDEPDPDIEIYSFDIDVRSIPIGEKKAVTFTAEIFSNISLEEYNVYVVSDDTTVVGFMNDDGVDGDATADDGIYTLQKEMGSDVEDYVEYYAAVADQVSSGLGIGYYKPLTEEELADIATVDAAIIALVESTEYRSASVEKRAALITDELNELVKQGLVIDGSVSYDETGRMVSYQYQSGVYGVVQLVEFSDDLNGPNDFAANAEESAWNRTGVSLAPDGSDFDDAVLWAETNAEDLPVNIRQVLIFNGFENDSFRRSYYEQLKRDWDSQGLRTTIDTDVTVADMKSLLRGYDVVVFAMHGSDWLDESRYVPVLLINESATSRTDAAYSYELRTRHSVVKSPGGSYYILPKFFGDNYSRTSLDGKLIYSESCKFYGCDCRTTSPNDASPNYAMADALTALSAAAVVGYHNSVEANYSRDVMRYTIEKTFGGQTVRSALEAAKSVYGADDDCEDKTRDKYIAYPLIRGNERTVLRSGGNISGSVKDAETGVVIGSALIRVYDTDGNLLKTARTSSAGSYSVDMPAGSYIIKVSAGYYRTAKMAVTVTPGSTVYAETFLMVYVTGTVGTTSGIITNAVTGLPVPNVTVRVRSGWNNMRGRVIATTTTNSNGVYEVSCGVGLYTIEYSKSGFVTGYKNIVVIAGLLTQNAVISPLTSEGVYRFVLSWIGAPEDLDSHLAGPTDSGSRFHLYFPYADANNGSPWPDYVRLDLDNVTISRRPDVPETTTIVNLVNGKYVYSVHDYSNGGESTSTALSSSNASVAVYKGDTLIQVFHVPTGMSGTIWTVFELDGDTILPINRFGNGFAFDDQLFDPYLGN